MSCISMSEHALWNGRTVLYECMILALMCLVHNTSIFTVGLTKLHSELYKQNGKSFEVDDFTPYSVELCFFFS